MRTRYKIIVIIIATIKSSHMRAVIVKLEDDRIKIAVGQVANVIMELSGTDN